LVSYPASHSGIDQHLLSLLLQHGVASITSGHAHLLGLLLHAHMLQATEHSYHLRGVGKK